MNEIKLTKDIVAKIEKLLEDGNSTRVITSLLEIPESTVEEIKCNMEKSK